MKRKKPILALLILLIVAGVATNARASVDIFMQISGVAGESMDVTHPGWNPITSFSQSVSNNASGPNFADIKLTKRLDRSSPVLDLDLNKGAVIPSILLEFQNTGGTPVVFYSINMENVTVTSISSEADSTGVTEDIRVKFTKITWTYWPVDSAGRRGTPVVSAWDLDTGKGD
jgi:type VI secretion system secreted protein Hcp